MNSYKNILSIVHRSGCNREWMHGYAEFVDFCLCDFHINTLSPKVGKTDGAKENELLSDFTDFSSFRTINYQL